jgi:3-dehydroquinate dehydratase/shikimate dehydrogenase
VGSGGAAAAVAFAAQRLGARAQLFARTPARARALCARLDVEHGGALADVRPGLDVIINATPVGMGNGKQSILSEPEINARYVMDMVYNPVDTRLLKLAKDRGAHTITGLEMFTNQAARQFEIWTGESAPRTVMEKAALEALALHSESAASGRCEAKARG